ncbi:MAG TPA: hypothetical protein VJU15_07475 [Gemmatimonadales bacterium]|nr:hypothetical protein [Gemmatimonadales bacterium]
MRHALILLAAAACSRAPGVQPGDLDVVWSGTERGRFLAPLVASHCPETGQVELLAIRGDTGVGIALFLLDSANVQPTDYLVSPGSQLHESRPGASMAARWFATTSIAAFEGVNGKVSLSAGGEALAGTLDVKFQALDRPDTLRMSGSFSQVPLQRADSNCRLIRKRNKL